jgi:hypothetical protein
MLIRRSTRRFFDARTAQLVAHMVQHTNALAAELATVRRERDEVYANFREYRDTVAARREAEAQLVEFYRERAIARAQAAQLGDAAWLH